MHSALSSIPLAKRRQLAATLGLFAALFVAVGVVSMTGTTTAAARAFSTVSLSIAVLLALMSWGVLHSYRVDLAEQRLNAAIEASIASLGRSPITCACGHDHDPDEMHVRSEECAHDGSGIDCPHSCDSCVLASLRPSPVTPRADRLPR